MTTKIKCLWIVALLVLLSLLFFLPAYAEEINIEAKSYVLMDMDTGEIILSKNKDVKAYPASTTKIMTGIITIKNSNLSDKYVASESAIRDIGVGGMNIGISHGEIMTNFDLLQAMLISSANEAANILSENVYLSRSLFVEEMNNKLADLDITNTHFTNVIGLHDDNHYTTASDLAYIAKYAMEDATFSEIVAKESYSLPQTNYHDKWDPLWVSNKLFLFPSEHYDKVLGIKTGHTSKAGYNLVSAAENSEGLRLLAVIMGVEGDEFSVFNESKKLLDYGFANYAYQVVEKPQEYKATYDVIDSENSVTIDLETIEGYIILLPKDKGKWNIEIIRNVSENIKAPISKGAILGVLDYYRDGLLIKSIELAASNDIEKSNKAELREKSNTFLRSKTLRNIVIASLCGIFSLALLRLFFKKVIYKKRRKRNYQSHW